MNGVLTASIAVMIACLIGEGSFLLFAGFPFPGLPTPLYAVGALWVLECTATAFYKKVPQYALIAGWLMLGYTVIVLSHNKNISRSAAAFLWQHSLELLFIGASHIGYWAARCRKNPIAAG